MGSQRKASQCDNGSIESEIFIHLIPRCSREEQMNFNEANLTQAAFLCM